jgi:hypothetical protein
MKHWLAQKFFASEQVMDEDEDFALTDDAPTACLEESVAYSSFLASGVAGIEDVSFEEFLRLIRSSPLRADATFES